MSVFRINIEISGDFLYPPKLIPKLSQNFKLLNGFGPGDPIIRRGKKIEGRKYEHGWMILGLPQSFCWAGGKLENYENQVVDFIKKNYEVIRKNGGTEITLSIDYFFLSDNFMIGIFDAKLLKSLALYDVDISLSGYSMTKKEMFELFGKEDRG